MGTIRNYNLLFRFLYEDAESMSLMIKDVSVEDAGIYEISATNELGSDKSSVNLVVKSPPKIKKPRDYVCMAEDKLKMAIEISGNPVPTTKYFLDGKEVHHDERIKFTIEGETHYVELHPAKLSDTGSYTVIATNELSQQSEFWNLRVTSKPTFAQKLGKEHVFAEKDEIALSVTVDGYPAPKVKWMKDGKEISPNDPRVKITNHGNVYQLSIANATRDDCGNFSVQFENEHGKQSDETRVHVKCGPKVLKPLKNITISEGDVDAEISIDVEAYPKPTIRWFYDSTEINVNRPDVKFTDNFDVNQGTYKLIINKATADMTGKYSCEVKNVHGQVESDCTVTVNCKPRVHKGLKDVEVEEGSTLVLEVEIYGLPDPTIVWFKNGQEVRADARLKISRDNYRTESYSLTLNLVKESDSGEYEIKASNDLGTVTSKSKVIVTSKWWSIVNIFLFMKF